MTSIYVPNMAHTGLRLPDQNGDIWQVTHCLTSEAADYRGEAWYQLYRLIDPGQNCTPWHNQDAHLSVRVSQVEQWVQLGKLNYWQVSDEASTLSMMEPCMPVVVTVADPTVIKNRYFRTLSNGNLEFFLPVAGVTARTKHKLYPMDFEAAVVHYLEGFIGCAIETLQDIDYDGYASRMTTSRGKPWE